MEREKPRGKVSEHMLMSAYMREHLRVELDPDTLGIVSLSVLDPEAVALKGKMTRELAASCAILRYHLEGGPVGPQDLRELRGALNLPVNVAIRDSRTQEIARSARPARFVAEDLLRYLAYFWEHPELKRHDPIRLCQSCGVTFIASKSLKARSCSTACYKAAWAREKLKENPRYFHEKTDRLSVGKSVGKSPRKSEERPGTTRKAP